MIRHLSARRWKDNCFATSIRRLLATCGDCSWQLEPLQQKLSPTHILFLVVDETEIASCFTLFSSQISYSFLFLLLLRSCQRKRFWVNTEVGALNWNAIREYYEMSWLSWLSCRGRKARVQSLRRVGQQKNDSDIWYKYIFFLSEVSCLFGKYNR